MGMRSERNTWLSCCACSTQHDRTVCVYVMPQTWIEEGEELGKEASSTHVGLNVTEIESKQDRGEVGKEARSVHVGLLIKAQLKACGRRSNKTKKKFTGDKICQVSLFIPPLDILKNFFTEL